MCGFCPPPIPDRTQSGLKQNDHTQSGALSERQHPTPCPTRNHTMTETISPFSLQFREAMSACAHSVHLITTDGEQGRFGMTMTAVMPLTDEPPTFVMAVNLQTKILLPLSAHKRLCLNVLSEQQQLVAEDFAGLTRLAPEVRFSRHNWTQHQGQWQVHGALAHLHGDIVSEQDTGTHRLFVVRVSDIILPDAREGALLYFRRHFATLPAPTDKPQAT